MAKAAHSHRFILVINSTTTEVCCTEPQTVLDAIISKIKTTEQNGPDDRITIQRNKNDKRLLLSTQFPCCCIEEGERLNVSCDKRTVEKLKGNNCRPKPSRDNYSVFCIDKRTGANTNQEDVFLRKELLKDYDGLCVYGEKGITVETAISRDGRFKDLGRFYLTDTGKKTGNVFHTNVVNDLDGIFYKINKHSKAKSNQDKPGTSSTPPPTPDTDSVEIKKEEVEKKLKLKEQMQSRWSESEYKEALEQRKEEFGKLEQSFSEIHRVKMLLEKSKSVCKVVVEGVCTGTGFVLFDNYILTNAHLFKGRVEGEKLKQEVKVYAFFKYNKPEPHTDYTCFQVTDPHVYFREDDLDYAVLQLDPRGRTASKKNTQKTLPSGLLSTFAPLPADGQACIVGHPAGGLKKMDPTWIIEKKDREKAINDHLNTYNVPLYSIRELISKQGIDSIMHEPRAGEVVTYNTFMYHGSSGSPLFDAQCRVVGLHTGGFTYGFPNQTNSVIEYAQPVLKIFEDFVMKLRERGDEKMLKRVEEEAQGNTYLEKVLKPPDRVEAEPAQS